MKRLRVSAARTTMIFSVLLFVVGTCMFHEGYAQKGRAITVALGGGRIVSGRLIGATLDSLLISDNNKVSVGCRVIGKLGNSPHAFKGRVVAVSDSAFVLAVNGPGGILIPYRQVKSVRVRAYPPKLDINRFRRSAVGYREIEWVQMNEESYPQALDSAEEKAGEAALAWTMGYGSVTSSQGSVASAAIPMGSIITPLTNIFRSTKTTSRIHGDRYEFYMLLRKIEEGGMKVHRADPGKIVVRATH
jgi:hypothetical protein